MKSRAKRFKKPNRNVSLWMIRLDTPGQWESRKYESVRVARTEAQALKARLAAEAPSIFFRIESRCYTIPTKMTVQMAQRFLMRGHVPDCPYCGHPIVEPLGEHLCENPVTDSSEEHF